MRKPVSAANWKMHKTIREASEFVSGVRSKILDVPQVDIILCASSTVLFHIAADADESGIEFGAQNCHWENEGAFTGEVSPEMLLDCGAQWVIVGHSERRHLFGETDEDVARKFSAAVSAGLRPILCVGETLDERQSGTTSEVIWRQLNAVTSLTEAEAFDRAVIAYEPVWAIGTGITAETDQIEEAHGVIRDFMKNVDEKLADEIRILYGGSVKPTNATELIEIAGVDGVLVGGASLSIDSFMEITQAISEHYDKG
ncbi:MAG TPA: triose-phosphate isomerase [Candidatus Marinimicrobia bacterium]|jgi:triosephosphate isomerase|nr:triose-phosphate isomerase [Candidatus Neomarinimicrobiota bacterium]